MLCERSKDYWKKFAERYRTECFSCISIPLLKTEHAIVLIIVGEFVTKINFQLNMHLIQNAVTKTHLLRESLHII